MRQILISAVTAAVVCVLAFWADDRLDGGDVGEGPNTDAPIDETVVEDPGRDLNLSVSVEPAEDSWIDGARSTGADDRMLSDADSSICFLTKIEISGLQSAEDTGTCRIAVDDFTGFWKVTAEVPEGSRSEIRCNARCLTWD